MKTFSCIVIDDEALVIQRLVKFFAGLAKQSNKFQLIGKAFSANEGIELALQLKPDIIITDIVMPGLNGIDMIERLKSQLPKTVFIILSAHPDFEYAKKAIAMNVLEYIVKVPLRDSNVLGALEKAAKMLESFADKETKLQQLSMAMQGNIHRLRKQVLEELLSGEIMPKRMEERSRELLLGFSPGSYCCCVIEIGDFETFKQQYNRSDQKTLKYAMLNIMEESIKTFGEGFACELGDRQFVGYMTWKTMLSRMHIEQESFEIGMAICKNVKHYLKQSVSVGFSKPVAGWASIVPAYREAAEALEDCFYLGMGTVVTPSRRMSYDDSCLQALRQLFGRLADKFTPSMDNEDMEEILKSLNLLLGLRKIPKPQLLALVRELVDQMDRKAFTWNTGSGNKFVYRTEEITSSESLVKLINRFLSEMRDRETAPYRTEIVKAMVFIERHLTERFSLQEVADHINMNPSYFGVLFKKEVQEGFIDYINRKKIEKAVELLQTRECSNLDLGEAVGITNERYFCTLFKKITGTSPQKYKKSLRRILNS